MKKIIYSLLALALPAAAQTATGTVPFTCSQSGTQVVCNFQATVVVPAGDALIAGPNQSQIVLGNGGAPPPILPPVLPPATTTDYCPGTQVRATFNASDAYRIFYTSDYSYSFPAGGDFVIQLNVAANDTTNNRYQASLEFSDFGSSRGGRYVTVSRNKCDYTSTAQFVSPVYLGTNLAVNAGSATVGIGLDPRANDVQLAPGRWYINIRNVVGACPANISCHALLRWAN